MRATKQLINLVVGILTYGVFPLYAYAEQLKNETGMSRVYFDPGTTVVPPKGSLLISIPVFNVDPLGLPYQPVALRIVFKDVTGSRGKNGQNTLQVKSRIEYRGDDPDVRCDKEEVNLPAKFLSGNDSWKVYKYTFQKTPFQLIRAINGVFTFRISSSADVQIPIRSAEVEALEAHQTILNTETERALRGWRRIIPVDNSAPNSEGSVKGIVAFARDPMRPVYEWSQPNQSEIGGPVRVLAAPEEFETISFGLYSTEGANDVTVRFLGFPPEITQSGEWYREVSDDRALTQSLSTYPNTDPRFPSVYGRIPDRLEPFKKLNLAANQSVRIWFKFRMPPEFAGQVLQSKVLVIRGRERIVAMPDVVVSVLPIPLDPSPHLNPVYHDPYSKTFHREQKEVWKFLREVGFDPFFYLDESKMVVIRDHTSQILDIDLSYFESQLDEMKTEGFLKNRFVVECFGWLMEREIKRSYGTVYDKLSDPAFQKSYGLLIRKVITLCENRGVSVIFSITDEPWFRTERMMRANRLAAVIRQNGGQTLTTYDTSADNWPCLGSDGVALNLGLKDLVDYKVWYVMSQGTGFLQGEPHYGYYTTFDAHLRNPIYNRFMHGLLAFRTKADVVAAFALGECIIDPFDDLDGSPDKRWWPDFVFGYPTWEGPFLGALNAEGVKEGIKDARYLATLERLMRDSSDDLIVTRAETFLRSLTERIDFNYLPIYGRQGLDNFLRGESYRQILAQVSEAGNQGDFEAFTSMRETTFSLIKELVAVWSPDDSQ